MNLIELRAFIVDGLFVLDAVLAAIIVWHLWHEARRLGLIPSYRHIGNQAAIAFGVHIGGLLLARAGDGYPPWVTIGLLISGLGIACCIRIFTPPRCGRPIWAIAVAAAIIFAVVRHYI